MGKELLYGLVLAGGKSQRMGEDKGAISYHGKPQREYTADLLAPFCEQTFISCRPDQIEELSVKSTNPTDYQASTTDYSLLPDTYLDLGPLGAIASAFRAYPHVAWLVVACDLPLLDQATVAQLVQGRNCSAIATAFQRPGVPFPEPLVTIWEPRSYLMLVDGMAQGELSLRKILGNSYVEVLEVEREEALQNVNWPSEREGLISDI